MKMSVEQILQLALQQAEKEAPPAPSAEWFRKQLAEHETKPEPKPEPVGQPLHNIKPKICIKDEKPPIKLFWFGLLQECLTGAGPGEKILVVNTAQEIPLEFLHGPTLDADGVVKFVVGLNPARLPLSDEDKFYLDVLFLLTSERVLLQKIVGKEEKNQLRSLGGLELQAKLPETPELESFLTKLREKLRQDGREHLALPKTAFVLRIWWKEN